MHQIRSITTKHLCTKEACRLRRKFWLVYDISANTISLCITSENYWNLKKNTKRHGQRKFPDVHSSKLYQKSASKEKLFVCFWLPLFWFQVKICSARCVLNGHQNFLLFLAKTMKTFCSLLTRKRHSFIFRWRRQVFFSRSFIQRRWQNGTIYNYICKHQGCCLVTWYCCDFLTVTC